MAIPTHRRRRFHIVTGRLNHVVASGDVLADVQLEFGALLPSISLVWALWAAVWAVAASGGEPRRVALAAPVAGAFKTSAGRPRHAVLGSKVAAVVAAAAAAEARSRR